MSSTSFDSASSLEPIPIDASLTLVPRVRLTLVVYPANPSHTKPVDDWQLKKALLDFLKNSLAVSLSVPDGDLEIRRVKDVRKRRRDEPVAHGSLVIRDLGFLKSLRSSSAEESGEEGVRVLEEKYADWKRYLVEKMNGMDLVLGGVKFMLSVEMPVSDSFEAMRKEWEEFYAFGNRGGYFLFRVCMCLCVFGLRIVKMVARCVCFLVRESRVIERNFSQGIREEEEGKSRIRSCCEECHRGGLPSLECRRSHRCWSRIRSFPRLEV